MFSKHFLLGLGAVGAAILVAGTAKAVTMDQLVAGQQIVIGNTVFSNFVYSGSIPASDVLVTASSTGLQTGLNFTTLTGGWTTPTGSSVITYDATITGNPFVGAGLDFSATATGGAVASVGETITDITNNKDYSLQVNVGTGSDATSDSVAFDPATTDLHVIKSIDVSSSGTGSASISSVDNTFSEIPEPMTIALLPLGIAALGLRRRFVRLAL